MARARLIISPHDAAGSAARRAITLQLSTLMEQVPGAAAGEAEPIHQVRVSTRRLRALIRLFTPYLSALKPREIDRELKWISNEAGKAREIDVITALTHERTRRLTAGLAQQLAPMWEELRKRRQLAAGELQASLESPRFETMRARLSAPIPITVDGDAPFASVAAGLAAPIVHSMMRQGERLPDDPRPADLHKLRVRAKRCRYALETMTGLDGKRITKLLAQLEEIQDVLGRHHDTVVASNWIASFVKGQEVPAETAFACGALTESISRVERKLKREGLRLWHDLRDAGADRAIFDALRDSRPQEASSDDALHHAPRSRRGSDARRRRRRPQAHSARA